MGHGERLEQLDAVQLRHRDVRQDETHRQSCAEAGEGLRSVRGLDLDREPAARTV